MAFEFNALELGANWSMQLHGYSQGFTRARVAMLERLRKYATAKGASLLPQGNKLTAASKRITGRDQRRRSTK